MDKNIRCYNNICACANHNTINAGTTTTETRYGGQKPKKAMPKISSSSIPQSTRNCYVNHLTADYRLTNECAAALRAVAHGFACFSTKYRDEQTYRNKSFSFFFFLSFIVNIILYDPLWQREQKNP